MGSLTKLLVALKAARSVYYVMTVSQNLTSEYIHAILEELTRWRSSIEDTKYTLNFSQRIDPTYLAKILRYNSPGQSSIRQGRDIIHAESDLLLCRVNSTGKWCYRYSPMIIVSLFISKSSHTAPPEKRISTELAVVLMLSQIR